MDDEVIIALRAPPARRAIGVGIVASLGVLLLWLALVAPPAAPLWLGVLVALGAVSLWGAWRMWTATAHAVELTEAGLRDSDGTVIARFAEIAGIDRGLFAFKPSNGFLLTLHEAPGRRWRPGLWWRVGRRAGIGGLTPRGPARAMADAIQIRLAARRS